MIAPEPFFEPRGTPFSEFHRIRALTALGHQVDLVTYPFGQPVSMPGLRVFRSLRPPLVGGVKVGPSLAKIPLDALLTLTAIRRAVAGRYDAIHSHEEGGVIGAVIAAALRVPHLYDMHSSLPQQLTNFAFSGSRITRRLFLAIERFMIRRSRVVIVICPSLEDTVRAIDPTARTMLIENAPGSVEDRATAEQAAGVRRAHALSQSTGVVLYTGTFEAYQGLDLLFEAMTIVARTRPDARLVLAGGKADQVSRAQEAARKAGIGDSGLSARGRRARLAAVPRHQYAAEDLSVPAVGEADRCDASADAHAGLERRHGNPDRCDAAGIRRRHRRGADRRRSRRPSRPQRAHARGHQVQLRGIPRTHAPGLRGVMASRWRHADGDCDRAVKRLRPERGAGGKPAKPGRRVRAPGAPGASE